MNWISRSPRFGDMVRVKFGHIYHYGIYVSDLDIIQFGPPPHARPEMKSEDISVVSTDIDGFLLGGALETCEFNENEMQKKRTPESIVEYAKKNIGRHGYNILYNNCEHFATECVFGTASCSQTDDVRAMFRNLPLVDVFWAKMPEDCPINDVITKERNDEIGAANHPRVKKEKYCAWRLLEYALDKSLGLKMEGMDISKNANGKWTSPSCYFSISHSDSLVAVVISRAPVGIDVESFDAPIKHKFADKILTEAELCEYNKTEDGKLLYLISKWSAKEAFFKKDGEAGFVPSSISVDQNQLCSKVIEIEDKKFICCVATKTPGKVRFFENIDACKFLS